MVTALLVAVVVLAAAFAWTNGVHDAANAVATSLSTGALTPRFGLAMAAVLNGVGALVGVDVALTIGTRILAVPAGADGVLLVLTALVAAIGWNLATWWLGLPSSSSHALIAGLVGAGLVAGARIDAGAVASQVVVPTLLSPLVGLAGAWLAVRGLAAALTGGRRVTLRRLRLAQSLSAAAVALGHGLQDGQKTVGVLVLALAAAGRVPTPDEVPLWTRLLAAAFLALGTAAGGWPLVRTLARRVAPLDALGGSAAQATTAAVLYLAGAVGAPVSSTHTVTAAVAGAGAAGGVRLVRWGVFRRILVAWLLTPAVCAAVAALLQALAS